MYTNKGSVGVTKLRDEAETKVCPHCGDKFKTRRKNKVYCSQSCVYAAWEKRNPRQRPTKGPVLDDVEFDIKIPQIG